MHKTKFLFAIKSSDWQLFVHLNSPNNASDEQICQKNYFIFKDLQNVMKFPKPVFKLVTLSLYPNIAPKNLLATRFV